MDRRIAIAIPKGCARHVCHITREFSPPMSQKPIVRAPTLSASKMKRGVNQRQLVVKAASSGEYQFGSGGQNIVDANMILLRKRMLDLKMQEANYKTPEEYMEWEKEIYPAYHAQVFRAMEWLQYTLINTRPVVAITLLSLISASVPLSILFVSANPVSRVGQIIMAFLSSLHS
eukprot:PITA_33218